MKVKHCESQNLYPSKVSLKNKGIIKKFIDEGKWIEFVSSCKRNAKGSYSDRRDITPDGT